MTQLKNFSSIFDLNAEILEETGGGMVGMEMICGGITTVCSMRQELLSVIAGRVSTLAKEE